MATLVRNAELAIQLALGLLFLFSGLGKLANARTFVKTVAEYQVLPRRLSSLAAAVVIAAECGLAFGHLTGSLLLIWLRIGITMTTCFAAAVLTNLLRGKTLACYCFGQGDEKISTRTLARLLLIIAGEAFLLGGRQPLYPFLLAPSDLVLGISRALMLFITSIWVLSLSDLVYLLRVRTRIEGVNDAE